MRLHAGVSREGLEAMWSRCVRLAGRRFTCFWGAPEASCLGLGESWAALGAGVGGLGPLSGLCGRSWAALGASVVGLGLLSGPLAAVLGRSRGLCGRSWGQIRAFVGGLGRGSGPM